MAAVWLVARRRLAVHWRGLVAAGILLGVGFGLCLASVAAARRTSSAYERILAALDAPDAAVAHGSSLDSATKSLRTIAGITRQRVYAGFLGVADGVDPALISGLLAPAGNVFPLELPVLRAGRLPDPDAPDEAFVNDTVAKGADLDLGDRLTFRLFEPGADRSDTPVATTVTVVGIGTLPVEAVRDQTRTSGVVVFSRAFHDEHRQLTAYSVSNVDLAPGFDASRDLAAAVRSLGHELQSARSQETDATNEALRPLIIVVAALGLLAFGATTIAAWQVIQRSRDRSRIDDDTLRTIGTVRSQRRWTELASSALTAAVAIVVALLTMLVASPVAPVGPLHDLDPAQGLSIDMTTAVVGSVAILLTIGLLTLGVPLARTPTSGLTLALRPERGRSWRSVAATTLAAVVLAICATFVPSAMSLTATPSRYGFSADLVAVNAYGDQSVAALVAAFRDTDQVVAATGYVLLPFTLDGRAVPGLAATAVKGDLAPTLLEGRPARTDREIVVGNDTLDSIDAAVGDLVTVEIAEPSNERGTSIDLRIVGVATFPAVNQIGTDVPRLGTGALITRAAYLRMGGDAGNQPEFTMVRLADEADPAAVMARIPNGFQDAAHTTTTWFNGTEPAEIRQLDAAMPYLRASLLIAYAVLLAVITHALWTRIRTNRHALAVLRAVGCTSRQLNAIAARQVLPAACAAIVIGIPLGIALGRQSFAYFARSLAVVDTPSTSVVTVGALVGAVLAAAAIACLVGLILSPPSRASLAPASSSRGPSPSPG